MSVAYLAVGWNKQKYWYDGVLLGLLLLALAGYGIVIGVLFPNTTFETFVIRFTAISALTLLHVILAIGPLCRLQPKFLQLLYNRRHLGVTMFVLALIHGVFSTFQFHGGGNENPLISVFTDYAREYSSWERHPGDIGQFPFEIFGFGALLILFVMAITSHDFWLRQLGPSVWKMLHICVYLAYFLVLLHVAFGAFQSERNALYVWLIALGFIGIASLHYLASLEKRRIALIDKKSNWVDAIGANEIQDGAGKTVWVAGKAIAVIKTKGKYYAVSNVCRHQGGPLGEGKVLNGCLTCPWHGYQYKPDDGCSPPPFTEVVPTFKVKVIDGRVLIDPTDLPLKTKHDGAAGDGTKNPDPKSKEFYVGWKPMSAPEQARFTTLVVVALALFIPGLMTLVALNQNPVDGGGYEFGVERTFTGVLYADPLPILHLTDQKIPGHESSSPNLILVGAGKFGAPIDLVNKGNGKRVTIKGSLLWWHNMVMLEMNDPASFKILGDSTDSLPVMKLGPSTLTGELVDTKCYFGAMRPASGKIHRGCAVRCLSGGVPPGILVRDGSGNGFVVMLTGQPGEQLEFNVDWAARTIQASGDLELYQGTMVMRADTVELQESDTADK